MTTIQNNIISVSGGKDSTALLLLAIERQTPNMQAVFADTGHEHAQTYEYLQYLSETVYPIRIIRADFTEAIADRRRMMERVISGEHKERSSNKYPNVEGRGRLRHRKTPRREAEPAVQPGHGPRRLHVVHSRKKG